MQNVPKEALKEQTVYRFLIKESEKAKFNEYLSLYLKDNCSDGKVNVKNEINISYYTYYVHPDFFYKDIILSNYRVLTI
jgi:hypothetical protein